MLAPYMYSKCFITTGISVWPFRASCSASSCVRIAGNMNLCSVI